MNIHGAKKGQDKQRQPVIAPDSAQSKTFISIMYGLGEGEIAGLANGYQSVYLEDTPLQNESGEFNFPNVKVDFRTGTNDQEYIEGFPDVSSETNVGVELKHGTPFVKAFKNLDLDALRVRLKWGALRQQNRENGDVSGVKIDYAIDIKTDNGGWVEALNTSINAKTSDAYERSHRIDLPKATTGWQLRVRRITPNSTSEFISDKMYIAAISEVIDLKLRYPNTALLGLRYDAESFSNVAKMSARCKGLIIKVPTNYDATTRTYDGLWNGEFKMAYSNNPAWVYYDLCTAQRYGLGGRLTADMIDKWSLYRLAQYCDQMVDDGMGGQEPRFTVNVYIQSAEGAFELLSKLAGVFRAISYWDGNSIVLDADIPQDSIYSFSRANVIDGVFEYSGTRARDRHTVAKVAWDNPDNHFKTEYEFVRDEKAISELGVRFADISAWGCTSKGQAQRAGLWALKSEQLETRMVTFKVGLDGYIPTPAKIIEISDELFAGRANGGRVVAINKNKTVITLDRPISAKAGDTLVINGNDGISQRRQIRSVAGANVTVAKAFGDISVENVWVLDSSDLATMKFRVLSVTADDNHTFTITAVQYNPAKYDAIDTGAYIDERPISVINPTVQAPTKSVNLSSYHTVNQGVSVTTLVIGWEQVAGAVKYQVEWRKDNGNWQTLPPTGTNSLEITGVYAGQYEARVTAISAFGQASTATHSALTQVTGKIGKPTKLAKLTAKGVLFGMDLAWLFGQGSDDTNYTEIQVSPDGKSNIATLGTFSYPTNSHTINGLQGNLTQFYRARIVDKLGNTSDWTAWTSGTTEARADKVLDILSGQISESHLDQTIRQPIAKIGTLENAVNAVNGNLSTLNSQLATAQNELNTAKNTLQTAVGNITTERNRISTAIRDITALQTANNAKTQEIANLTQTMNGHTSSIRELGVTTGDLSQKYAQLKTASDTASGEITAIKQTQAGQATTINRLNSEMASKASTANLETLRQTLTDADTALGQRISAIDTAYKQADNATNAKLGQLEQSVSDKDRAMAQRVDTLNASYTALDSRTKWVELTATADLNTLTETGKYFIRSSNNPNAPFAQYAYVSVDKANNNRITQRAWADNNASLVYIRVYNGTWQNWQKTATKSELDSKASIASLDEFKSAQATKDSATANKLSQLESSVNGRLGTAESKITTLERTTSDTNQALATAQSQLNARFDNLAIGGRNLLLNSKQTLTVPAGEASNRENQQIRMQVVNVDWSAVKQLTLSVDVKHGDDLVRAGNRWWRIALELSVPHTDGTTSYPKAMITAPVATAFNGRISYVWNILKEIKTVNHAVILVQNINSASEIVIANPKLEIGTIATDWTPAPEDVQTAIDEKASTATLDEFKSTQATKDSATTNKLSQLESGLGTKANTTALSELSTRVSKVDEKLSTEAQKVGQLQTTVSGQTTSIRNMEQSVNGVRAIKAVTVDNNGFISGYGLMSELQNGRVTSRFGINADQIYFGATTSAKKPFIFATAPTTIDGVSYPAGAWFNSAHIARASITMLHIADTIQSDNYVAGKSGWRLFKDGELEINSSFDDGTRIQLNSRGLTGWYGNGQKAFELGILS